jgi:hypothetical protein
MAGRRVDRTIWAAVGSPRSALRAASARRAAPPLALLAFIALHAPLGVAMRYSRAGATAHALATLAVGLYWALKGQVERVAYLCLYIAGAEVLWRMTKIALTWEYGKQITSLILLVTLLRVRATRFPLLPILFFSLLLPSIPLTVSSQDFAQLRRSLSQNLSGPLSLTLAACFFGRLAISREEFSRLFLALLAPVAAISAIIVLGIASAESIQFAGASNFTTSGGFGPNQVSTTLGLGALAALLCALTTGEGGQFRTIMLCVTMGLAAQSAMTFSRSGLYCLILSTGAAMMCAARNPVVVARWLAALAAVAVVSYYLIAPALDDFTGGALSARFAETNTSNRYDFMVADFKLWMEHPILGVGPAGSKEVHGGAASHSEITRLLSEHGLPGLAALLLLGVMAARNVVRAGTVPGRAICAALGAYSLLLIASNGMRIVSPSVVYGLCFAIYLPEEERGA